MAPYDSNNGASGSGRLFLIVFFIGVLTGGTLALLLAPEPGKDTRGRIRSRTGPLADKVKDRVRQAASRHGAGNGDAQEGEFDAG